ncbi:hypothetical protein CRYUN_Cryun13aG0028600 [Craigia yunnanensis]
MGESRDTAKKDNTEKKKEKPTETHHEAQMRESRDTHLQGKLCDICGDVGYEELIRTCSQCTIGRHIYCMQVLVTDVSEDWVCEVCLPKNDIDSLKFGEMEDFMDSSREVCFNLGRQVACKRRKAVETGKVKFLPTEEVIKLSSGSPKKEFPLKNNFGSKPVPAKFTPHLSKRTFTGSKTVDPYFRNPSFLQLGSVSPPRRPGVHISSSISQNAVKTPKESKAESAHVVPNKENVCKGQILDAILPEKGLTLLHTKTEKAMRSSRPSPSRLRTAIVGQNFHDAAENENSDVAERKTRNLLKISLYRPHVPALYTTWMGGFKFLDTATPGEFYGGFLARPPCRVHRKAYEFSQKMPSVLQVNLLQQCHLQTDLFQNGCLDLCDIGLYFFPVDHMERSQKNYNQLFQLMAIKNSVMISYIDGVELLIFTSKQLHADSGEHFDSVHSINNLVRVVECWYNHTFCSKLARFLVSGCDLDAFMKMTNIIVMFIDVFTGSNTDFFGGVIRRSNDNQMKVHQKLPSVVSHLEYADDDNANMDSRDLSSVIEPISVEFEQDCCNDSDLPSKTTEKMKSKFALEHPLESSLRRLPGSVGETDIASGFEVMSKLNSSDRATKAQVQRRKLVLAYQYHLINDPSAACPPPSLLGEGNKVGPVIKIKGNDNEKPFERGEKKGLQGTPFLSKDKSQIAGSCAVEVKAEVQEVANDPSAVCPRRLLNKETKIGLQIKTQEFDEEKPDKTRQKKGLQAGSFNGP